MLNKSRKHGKIYINKFINKLKKKSIYFKHFNQNFTF